MKEVNRFSLTKRVFSIAWPMIISELGDSLYSIADTYFVSRLGPIALAAVAVGSYLSWLFFVAVILFTIGVLVITAQSYGAGKIEESRKALGTSIVFGSLFTLAIAILTYYVAPIIVGVIVGTKGELLLSTTKYFSIRILGLPILLTAFSMDSAIRGVGATKYSMIALLSSSFLNIVLDPILIYGLFGLPPLGVVGAALATVISVSYIVPLEYVFLVKLGLTPSPKVSLDYLKRILSLGIPTSTERLIFSLGNNIYIALIARCGSAALAAHQIGLRIESFIYMPGFAFSVAASTLVGQEIGRGDIVKGKELGMEAAKVASLFMGVLGLLIALTSSYVVRPFSPNPDIARLASIYLVLAGLSEPGLALAMTLSGAIRGGGNTLVPMIFNILGLYLFRVVPAYFLVLLLELGVVGAWLAMFIDVYLRGFILLAIYDSLFTKLVRRIV